MNTPDIRTPTSLNEIGFGGIIDGMIVTTGGNRTGDIRYTSKK